MKNNAIARILSGVCVISMVCNGMTCIANAEDSELMNIKFDNYITNRGIDNVVVSPGEPRVVEDGERNKSCCFPGGYGKIAKTVDTLPKEFTLSFDIKTNKNNTDFIVKSSNSETEGGVKIIDIQDNVLLTSEKKHIGSISHSYKNITVAVDNENLVYSVYIDGKMVLNEWKLSKKLGSYISFENMSGSSNIDNICLKPGLSKKVTGSPVTYNSIADAAIDYDYFTNSDVAFIDTDTGINDRGYILNNECNYVNAGRYPKTNTITLNRIDDRENPNRENAYIIIDKYTDENAYYDFHSLYQPKYGHFAGYLYTGRVRVDTIGAPVLFCYFRDTRTTGSYVEVEPARIYADGKVITKGGKTVKQLSEGEWLNFKVWLDMENHKYQFYIDEVLMEEAPFSENFNIIEIMRICVEYGAQGKATFDNLRFIGMRDAYNHSNGNYHPTQQSSDKGIETFLSDKTAFYQYSENVVVNGKKNIRVSKPIEKDGVMYVSSEALSVGYELGLIKNCNERTAEGGGVKLKYDSSVVEYNGESIDMGTPCICENKELYIPIEAFAEKVLNQYVKNDGKGLVITSKNQFDLYTDDTVDEFYYRGTTRFEGEISYYEGMTPNRVLDRYMQYERPTKETLLADFNKTTNNGEMRPRVIATKEDFDRIRKFKDTDERLKKVVDAVISSADEKLSDGEQTFALEGKQRILDKARYYLERNLVLGFAYQVTGEEKYAEKLWQGMETVLKYPDWNQTHMIDSGEMLMNVSIGYDWIYDYLTEEQREFVRERVMYLGLNPADDILRDLRVTRETYATGDFVNQKTNFNAVVNSGTITACLAFGETNQDKIFEILQNAIRSIENSILNIQPDGSWPESTGYWDYAFSYLSRSICTLMNSTKNHYGLMDSKSMEKTGEWYVQNNSYGGHSAFHDSPVGQANTNIVSWLAKYFDDDNLKEICYRKIDAGKISLRVEDAIYYDPYAEGDADAFDLDAFYSGLDHFYSRSSFTDNNGLYVAAHAGQVKCYHSQADVGTFVYDYNGIRWGLDFGKEDYDLHGSGVAYRNTMQGHNVMIYDMSKNRWGCIYDDDTRCYTDRYESKERGSLVIYDMHEPYAQFASAHHRGFYVGDDRTSLTIQDRFTTLDSTPSYWLFHTKAEVEVVDNETAILSQNGKKLRMEVRCDVPGYTLETSSATPIEGSENDAIQGQNPNMGVTRIQVKMPIEGIETHTITVKFSDYDAETTSIDEMTIPMEEWAIPDGEYNPAPVLNAANIRVNGKLLNEVIIDGKIATVQGEPLPVITAEAEDSENSVEILYNDDETAGIVRVWNSDQTEYSDTTIGFNVTKSADLSGYNVLEVADYTVSSTLEEWNPKESMFDNNFLTRWTSNNAKGEYAIFDLGEQTQVDAVAAAFWQGNTRNYKYEIQLSVDGNTWTSVRSGASAGETEGFELFDFTGGNYRFVKFIGNGNQVNLITNILEFRVLQKK